MSTQCEQQIAPIVAIYEFHVDVILNVLLVIVHRTNLPA